MIYLFCPFHSGCSSCHPCSDSLHFRNLIRPVWPKIKGPFEWGWQWSIWDLLHVILSKTSREKNESMFERGRSMCCIYDESSWEYSIPACLLHKIFRVQCMARPSISTADSYWLSGGEDRQGAYLSHFPPPALQKHSRAPKVDTLTLPHAVCKDPFPPTQACELAALSHTQTGGGASVTADYDRNGWKLLFSPVLSLAVYSCVPPSLIHSFWRFNLYQAGVKPQWVPQPLPPSFLLYFFTTFLAFNFFSPSAFYTPPLSFHH